MMLKKLKWQQQNEQSRREQSDIKFRDFGDRAVMCDDRAQSVIVEERN